MIFMVWFLAPTGAQGFKMSCLRACVPAYVRLCICAGMPDIMLRRAQREFLKHSKESREAQGQEREGAQKRANFTSL